MLANLLNIRNIAIIAGLCATAFAVQSLRINWLKTDKRELKIELLQAKQTISNYKEANQTNQTTIAKLQQANQQCAQSRELNEQTAVKELARQQGALADLERKYNKAKEYADKQKKDKPYICGYNVYIDPELVTWLRKDKVHNPN